MEQQALIDMICRVILDKKGMDVRVLNVRDVTAIADYFIIGTARNPRMARSISEAIDEKLGENHTTILRTEGYKEGNWILQDLGGIMIHILIPEERSRYQLDQLWSDAKVEYENRGE
ncbi:MAG TPA: ribosome silencing factor [Veillonellaceae bacterium]|jgi:ribosome-associated protein|nr:ribosome silencing factor [Veillonellaceae bacterium]